MTCIDEVDINNILFTQICRHFADYLDPSFSIHTVYHSSLQILLFLPPKWLPDFITGAIVEASRAAADCRLGFTLNIILRCLMVWNYQLSVLVFVVVVHCKKTILYER